MTVEAASVVEMLGEFSGADLRDKRLRERLHEVAAAAVAHPGKSFPEMFGDDAATEGGYRFLSNDRVTAGPLAEPHARETCERIAGCETVLVVQDTSPIMMCGDALRDGLGPIGGTKGLGFYFHAALAMDAETLRPLGVPTYMTWAREEKPKLGAHGPKRSGSETVGDPNSESRRWLLTAQYCADRVGADVARRMIFVADSEADAFWLLRDMDASGLRFVTRLARDRHIVDGDAETVVERMAAAPIRAELEVPIVARKGKQAPRATARSGERTARTAHLDVTAAAVTLRAPRYEKTTRELDVNVVRVREASPPAGEPPIDWVLYTSEPIQEEADVRRVIAHYRARWLIEEFFKALKTGCLIEKRQLESYHALTNALALFIPIAWWMLLLRNVARTAPDAPATDVLTADQVNVLNRFGAKRLRLGPSSTARDALLAVAGLGGHMGGKPGWLVLARGMEKVEQYVEIWRAAIEAHRDDVRNR
jgi:hypothetical protein